VESECLEYREAQSIGRNDFLFYRNVTMDHKSARLSQTSKPKGHEGQGLIDALLRPVTVTEKE